MWCGGVYMWCGGSAVERVSGVSYPGPQGVMGPPGPENTYRHPITAICSVFISLIATK